MKFVLSVCALLFSSGAANACAIKLVELSKRIASIEGVLGISVAVARDPDSGEPMRQYSATLENGSQLFVKQRHCEIENLSMSLLSTSVSPTDQGLSTMAAALGHSEVWARWFDERDAEQTFQDIRRSEAVLEGLASGGTFTVDVSDMLDPEGESGEASFSYVNLSDSGGPILSATSLDMSVGGL